MKDVSDRLLAAWSSLGGPRGRMAEWLSRGRRFDSCGGRLGKLEFLRPFEFGWLHSSSTARFQNFRLYREGAGPSNRLGVRTGCWFTVAALQTVGNFRPLGVGRPSI